jgi:hypothetical protein
MLGETLGETLGDALPVTDVVIEPPPASKAGVPVTRFDVLGESPLVVIEPVPSADCHAGVPAGDGGVAPVVAPTVMVPEPCGVEIWIGACAPTAETGNPTPINSPTAMTHPSRTFEVNERHEVFIFPPLRRPPREPIGRS